MGRVAALRRTIRNSGLLWASTAVIDQVTPFAATRLWSPRTVAGERLGAFLTSVFRAWGMPDDQISVVVEKILYADMRGIDSHGCAMLATYDKARAEGRLSPAPVVSLVHEGDVTALVDGGGGLGHVPATLAMERAIGMCRTRGVGIVAVRNSGHFGAAGAYAAMAAEHGFIGLTTTSTPTPAVVPTFGTTPSLGTNPIAIAAPGASGVPFLLDMATSTVSLGLLFDRRREGSRIPEGWALDDRGAPATGNTALRHRRLTPLGGDRDHGSHKGYGLAVAVEILSSVLPGVTAAQPGVTRSQVGHFFVALDPTAFRPDGGFGAEVDGLVDGLRRTTPRDPSQPVLVAGDVERIAFEERTQSGVPIQRAVFEDLRGVARENCVAFVLDEADR